jgi:hypothetical protein
MNWSLLIVRIVKMKIGHKRLQGQYRENKLGNMQGFMAESSVNN